MKRKIQDSILSEQSKYGCLLKYCSRNLSEQLEEFLEVNEKIDVIFDEGVLFKTAALKGHFEILSILTDYYKKTQLSDWNKESCEYKFAKYKLESIVENILNSYIVSANVISVVREYIPKQSEVDMEDMLDHLPLDRNYTVSNIGKDWVEHEYYDALTYHIL